MKEAPLIVTCPTCGQVEINGIEYFFDREDEIFLFPFAKYPTKKSALAAFEELCGEMYGGEAEVKEDVICTKRKFGFCHLQGAAPRDEAEDGDDEEIVSETELEKHIVNEVTCWEVRKVQDISE